VTELFLKPAAKGEAKYVGKGVEKILNYARKTRVGDGKRGRVPPKVLRDVLYHGYVREDELSAQYFGGVLASSLSGINRDDRGSSLIQFSTRSLSDCVQVSLINWVVQQTPEIYDMDTF
jgi:hypothetical protein